MTAPGASAAAKLRALVVTSDSAPAEIVEPVCRAIEQGGMELCLVDVGRAGRRRGTFDRVLRSVVGEIAERRLLRGLLTTPPEVTIAFDPASVVALSSARDDGQSLAPVVAVVPTLAPDAAWGGTDADRYLTVDDSTAVALSDMGIDGTRAIATGPIGSRRFADVTKLRRSELRDKFKLKTNTVVLCSVEGFDYETTQQLALQLALAGRSMTTLFDCGTDAQAATALRRQVPTLDMRAKLFGRTDDAASLWRCANIVVSRPTPRAVFHALLLGARFVALSPEGEAQLALAKALEERGIGTIANTPLLLSSALAAAAETTGNIKAYAGRNGARIIADVVRVVADDRAGVLDESRGDKQAKARRESEREAASAFAADAQAAADARVTAAPSGLEDLGGFFGEEEDVPEPSGVDVSELARMRAEVKTKIDQAKKRVWDAREAADKWDKRMQKADAAGRDDLVVEARKAGDAQRARMHGALKDLASLELEDKRLEEAMVDAAAQGRRREQRRATAGSARPRASARPQSSVDDMLRDMKKKQGKSVDDELAALKRKMRKGK